MKLLGGWVSEGGGRSPQLLLAKVLTIAGSDPSGGAGIEADLKTFTILGVFGMSVITALTRQDSFGVKEIFPVPTDFVRRNLKEILEEKNIGIVKTGMLVNREIVHTVAEILAKYRVKNLIIDPVIISKNGVYLLKKSALPTLKKELLPLAFLITPNIQEAEMLGGIKIKNLRDMKAAAEQLKGLGPRNILIKGGHLPGKEVIDLFFDGDKFYEFRSPRITGEIHGLGCVLSAAISAYLARGIPIKNAIRQARFFLESQIKASFSWGKGYRYLPLVVT